MHSEVSHHLSSVEVTFFFSPHLMTLHRQGLRFAFCFGRGLVTDCFVGIISLSKNSASNPDVCGSNLYLQREREKGGRSGQGCTHSARTVPHHVTEGRFPTYSPSAATARVCFHPQNSIPGLGELFFLEQHHQHLHPRPVWMTPGLDFGVPTAGAGSFGSREKGQQKETRLTACWKSVDMPMLSSTFSTGRFSFSHTSCRKDSSI